MRALTLLYRQDSLLGEAGQLLCGTVFAAASGRLPLTALAVLDDTGIVPHSAVECSAAELRGAGASASGRFSAGAPVATYGCGWVTGRRLGVAHPMCALEMLHCEGGAEDDGAAAAADDAAAQSVCGHAVGASALRTLRISVQAFSFFLQVCRVPV